MKNFLSQYHPRYIRSLVYMLQASEYHIGDYLLWYRRTKNFSAVEYRKQLVHTRKAMLISASAWIIVLLLCAIALFLLSLNIGFIKYILSVGLLLSIPYIVAYVIIVPIFLVRIFIQTPIEYYIVWRATQKLKAHRAIKIAIAGSFGKTSMREILKTIIGDSKKVAAPPHSYNTPLSISRFVETLTGNEEVLIFELGEYYPGDVRKLCKLTRPDIGIITGVNEAHLEKFKSLDRTVSTIFELADWLGGEKKVYVNDENTLARKHASRQHVLYSRAGVNAWKVSDPYTDIYGTSFTLSKGGKKLLLHTDLLGLHQIGPVVAAIDIALQVGVSVERIKQAVAKTKPFAHRLEPKTDAHGVTTLDDSYNGNPDGVKAVIEFLAAQKGGRRFYMTPGLVEMGDRTKVVHQKIGEELASAGIEKVVLIRNSVTPYIAEGLDRGLYRGEIIWFDDALVAFRALSHLTIKGDIVLLQNDWPDQYA